MDLYATIAEFYDCEHRNFRADIGFYLQMVRNGPVLEVGCGTGRITGPLAQSGLEIWGVDNSPAMLDRARRLVEMSNVHLVEGSIASVDLPTRFRTALLPLNTLWHFPCLADQVRVLQAVRRHLEPGGLLLVDLTNPHSMADRGADGTLRQRFRGPCGGSQLTIWSAAWDDEGAQRLTLSLMYDRYAGDSPLQRSQAELQLRYMYRPEAELALQVAAFSVRHVYGSYELDPYETGSSNILIAAEAVDLALTSRQ